MSEIAGPRFLVELFIILLFAIAIAGLIISRILRRATIEDRP